MTLKGKACALFLTNQLETLRIIMDYVVSDDPKTVLLKNPAIQFAGERPIPLARYPRTLGILCDPHVTDTIKKVILETLELDHPVFIFEPKIFRCY